MSVEVILGAFFIFILIVFMAGLFLFPHVFGISKKPSHEDSEQTKK